jgi:hypothetical protein
MIYFTINSNKLGYGVDFRATGAGDYAFVKFCGSETEMCSGGRVRGSTLAFTGSPVKFATFCRRWFAQYIRD